MNYHFKFYKEKNGFWAECVEIPGCSTQGGTFKELKSNAYEALNLHLDEPEDSKVLFPLPNRKPQNLKNIIDVKVDPSIGFAFLMRRTRLKLGLTQHQMKQLLQFKTLYAYQKLEKSKFANPTLKTLDHIKMCIPDFPFQYLV